jgi:hypothetical protein
VMQQRRVRRPGRRSAMPLARSMKCRAARSATMPSRCGSTGRVARERRESSTAARARRCPPWQARPPRKDARRRGSSRPRPGRSRRGRRGWCPRRGAPEGRHAAVEFFLRGNTGPPGWQVVGSISPASSRRGSSRGGGRVRARAAWRAAAPRAAACITETSRARGAT